jgi:hypothetical protein
LNDISINNSEESIIDKYSGAFWEKPNNVTNNKINDVVITKSNVFSWKIIKG